MTPQDIPEEFWNRLTVERFTTLSRATIYRKVKDGSFPQPVRVSANRIAWRADDIRALMG